MKRNIMKEAHKMTKEIKEKYNDVDYKVQLGLCISFLSQKEEEKEMLKENYKAVAVNSGLEMDIFVEEISNKVEITKITAKDQMVFEKGKNAKLGVKDNKFYVRLENAAFKNFKKLAGIKTNLKSACVIIDAEDLKEVFIELPKLREKEQREKEQIEYEKEQIELKNKLNENSTIVIERNFAKLAIRNEFENSSLVKDILEKIEKNLDCRVMDFEQFKVSEIKTDFCFSETYEIPFLELKKIEKIADEIENKRKLEIERIANEKEKFEKEKFEKALKKAKETCEPQPIKIISEFVERGDSDVDNIVTYVYPDGSIREERGPVY